MSRASDNFACARVRAQAAGFPLSREWRGRNPANNIGAEIRAGGDAPSAYFAGDRQCARVRAQAAGFPLVAGTAGVEAPRAAGAEIRAGGGALSAYVSRPTAA